MSEELRHQIEFMKREMLKGAAEVRRANEVVPVSGERRILSLSDRNIGVVYYPAPRRNAPLIIGFHGGGFLFGGSGMDDRLWSEVAKQLDANVASVDYRMAPEFKFPAPVEDAYESAVYLREHAEDFGFDAGHISVMGSSAGANLATAACLCAKDRGGVSFDYQILVYPALDSATDPMEKGCKPDDAGMYYVFNDLYTTPEQAKNPLCSPRFASDEQLKGLPPAIICPAEFDILCAESIEYAKRLVRAGVKVWLDAPAKGMPHGYFEFGMNGSTMGDNPPLAAAQAGPDADAVREAAQATLDYIRQHYNQTA